MKSYLIIKKYHTPFFLTTFSFILLLGLYFHEMWRDELWTWLFVTRSESFMDMLSNVRYSSHPLLWFVSLYPIKLISNNPIGMQVLHFLLTLSLALIVYFFAPFEKKHRIMFLFGYFPVYEYGVISRNYAIGFVLIFLFCVFFKKRHQSYTGVAIVLSLCAHANPYAFIMSLALFFLLLIDALKNKNNYVSLKEKKYLSLACFLFALLSIILAAIYMLPPEDCVLGRKVGFSSTVTFTQTLSTIWKAMVPIPKKNIYFWNTNIINSQVIQAILSCFLIGVTIYIIQAKRIILLFYLIGSLGFLLFFHFFHYGYLRHHGHLYMIFIVSLWLAYYIPTPTNHSFNLSKLKSTIITVVFSLHILSLVIALFMDIQHPFSASKLAANFIEKNYPKALVIGHYDSQAIAIEGHLKRPIYYPGLSSWNPLNFYKLGVRKEIRHIDTIGKKMALTKNSKVILALTYSIKEGNGIIPLTSFRLATVKDENYHLYLIDPKKL